MRATFLRSLLLEPEQNPLWKYGKCKNSKSLKPLEWFTFPLLYSFFNDNDISWIQQTHKNQYDIALGAKMFVVEIGLLKCDDFGPKEWNRFSLALHFDVKPFLIWMRHVAKTSNGWKSKTILYEDLQDYWIIFPCHFACSWLVIWLIY